jgi:hypothetical protein
LVNDHGSVCYFGTKSYLTPSFFIKDNSFAANSRAGTAVVGNPQTLFYSAPETDVGGRIARGEIFGNGVFTMVNANDGDRLGFALAAADGLLVALAPGDDGVAADAGAIWLFRSPRPASMEQYGNREIANQGTTAPGLSTGVFASFTHLSMPQDVALEPEPSFQAKIGGPIAAFGIKESVYVPQFPHLIQTATTGPGIGFFKPGSITQVLNNADDSVWLMGKTNTNKRRLQVDTTEVMTEGSQDYRGAPFFSVPVKKIMDGRADSLTPFLPVEATFATPITLQNPASTDSAVVLDLGNTPFIEQESGLTVGGALPYNNGQMPTRLCLNGGRLCYAQFVTGFGVTPATNAIVQTNTIEIARKGFAPFFIKSFLGESVRADGAVTESTLIRATIGVGLGPVTPQTNEALISTRSGVAVMLIQKNIPFLGTVIQRFIAYHLTLNGDILLLAQLRPAPGSGVNKSNDVALLHNRYTGVEPGSWSVLLREGDRIPGKDGARIGVIQKVDFTSGPGDSHYGALVTLVVEKNGSTAANNLAWLVGDAAQGTATQPVMRLPRLKLRKGILADGPIGKNGYTTFKLPMSTIDPSGAANTGMAHAVSALTDDSSLVVQYPNKTQALLLINEPVETP